MSLYRRESTVVWRFDQADPRAIVTSADVSAEQAVIAAFSATLGCNILAEECGSLILHDQAEYRVVVDALDGTRNFVDRTLGLFGISVAVEKGNEIVAGAICLPFFDELLVAEKGKGAYRRVPGKQRLAPVRRRDKHERANELGLKAARICVGRGLGESSRLAGEPMSTLLASCGEVLNYASCSVALFCAALGTIDGVVLLRQNYWDFAAGYRILHELGGLLEAYEPSWGDRVDEARLTRARSDEQFDILAARTPKLAAETRQVLTGTIEP
jgi:myo-inositol-1(or 4)-monophosphatase